MTYKTVALALIAEGERECDAAIGWAIDLAGRHKAHLAVGLGVPPLINPVDGAAAGMMATYEEENIALRKQSERHRQVNGTDLHGDDSFPKPPRPDASTSSNVSQTRD